MPESQELPHLTLRNERVARFVSHDVRTPLFAVSGFAKLLLLPRTGALSASQRAMLEDVLAATKDLESRLENLVVTLDLRRVPAHYEPDRCALWPLVQRAMASAAAKGNSSNRIVATGALTSAQAFMHPRMLERVLGIGLDNALVHSRTPGPVEVDIQPGTSGKPSWVVSIQDRGVGMSPMALAQAQLPPEAREPNVRGLGLWLAGELLTRYGGALRLASSPEGTRFEAHVPTLNTGATA